MVEFGLLTNWLKPSGLKIGMPIYIDGAMDVLEAVWVGRFPKLRREDQIGIILALEGEDYVGAFHDPLAGEVAMVELGDEIKPLAVLRFEEQYRGTLV